MKILTAIDRIRQGESEEEVASPITHRNASEVPYLVEIALCRETVHDQSAGRDDRRRYEYTKPHLSLTYVAVAFGKICGKPI